MSFFLRIVEVRTVGCVVTPIFEKVG